MINPTALPNISIVVAVDEGLGIGKDNQLLWHLGSDLKHFKQLTMGHPIVMGRRTWESLPKRPLPGRRNIVLTSNHTYNAPGAEVVHSIGALLQMLHAEQEEVFVIGGASIYQALMPYANRLCVTHVLSRFDADTHFPSIDMSQFNAVPISEVMTDEASGLQYQYVDYYRKPQPTAIAGARPIF